MSKQIPIAGEAPPKANALLLLLMETLAGVALSLLSLIAFLKLADEVLEQEVTQLDVQLANVVYGMRDPALTQIMFGLTAFGQPLLVLLAVALVALLVGRRHFVMAGVFALVLSLSFALNNLLKALVQRPRPLLAPLDPVSSYSFPSGHSMNALVGYAFATYLAFRLLCNKAWGVPIAVAASILILLIGFSRVYLGVHYPSDVLAGYLAGFWLFVTAVLLERTFRMFRLYRARRRPTRDAAS